MKFYCCTYSDERNYQISIFLRSYGELSKAALDVRRKGFNPLTSIVSVSEDSKRTVIPLW